MLCNEDGIAWVSERCYILPTVEADKISLVPEPEDQPRDVFCEYAFTGFASVAHAGSSFQYSSAPRIRLAIISMMLSTPSSLNSSSVVGKSSCSNRIIC